MGNIISKEQAFGICLPKWPQCIIEGPKLDPKDALEIIRRTDYFFDYETGNNHAFIKETDKILNIPQYEDFKDKDGNCDFEAYHEARSQFEEKWGLVKTEYIGNNWVSSSSVYGPNGFCHPDGTIWYQHNIGKWPDVEEIYDDLKVLGEAFPNLEMICTLMNAEEGEYADGLLSIELKNGKITFMEPVRKNNDGIGNTPWRNILNLNGENYFSLTQIKIWADQVYGK